MQQTKAGKFEYQIEAELLHEFATNGARYPAYSSIVAGGDNANILHYTDNDDVLNDGDLLLIDAGGELAGYAADITRTFPVNGKFTAAQQVIYQLVLDSQNLAIAAIKPEQNLAELNHIVSDFLTRGLYDLGILKGNLNILLVQRACKKYFIHGLGHWLGLDVHDVGDYHASQQREQLRPFVAGMVMTIEPGIYIPKNDQTVDEKWRGIGVRIEDNVLVTATGYENLTVNAPKTIAEIEALMA
jgi:Xaa-Pro aminopeptidase